MLSLFKSKREGCGAGGAYRIIETIDRSAENAEPVRRIKQQNIKASEDCSMAFAAIAKALGMTKAELFEDMVAERLETSSPARRASGIGDGVKAFQSRAWAMSDRSLEDQRSYPPDYVSAETLAYRLDCSRSTIDSYVRLGLLPKPQTIGTLQRWDFGQVKAFIKAQNAPSDFERMVPRRKKRMRF